jgi:hypothetical protein
MTRISVTVLIITRPNTERQPLDKSFGISSEKKNKPGELIRQRERRGRRDKFL